MKYMNFHKTLDIMGIYSKLELYSTFDDEGVNWCIKKKWFAPDKAFL